MSEEGGGKGNAFAIKSHSNDNECEWPFFQPFSFLRLSLAWWRYLFTMLPPQSAYNSFILLPRQSFLFPFFCLFFYFLCCVSYRIFIYHIFHVFPKKSRTPKTVLRLLYITIKNISPCRTYNCDFNDRAPQEISFSHFNVPNEIVWLEKLFQILYDFNVAASFFLCRTSIASSVHNEAQNSVFFSLQQAYEELNQLRGWLFALKLFRSINFCLEPIFAL